MFKNSQVTRATFRITSIFGILVMFFSTVFAATLSYTTNLTDASPTSFSPRAFGLMGLYEKVTCFTVTSAGNVTFDVSVTGSTSREHDWVLSSDDDVLEASDNFLLFVDTGDSGSTTESLATGDYTLFVTIPNVSSSSGNPTYTTNIIGDVVACGSVAPVAEEVGNTVRQRAFFDDRINDFDTGNPVVLYGLHEGNDTWGLAIYDADDTGLLLSIPSEQIATVAECPDSNTLIYTDDATGIVLYRLSINERGVCPFQLTAPTGESGKVYTIIFDTLYPHTYYESYEEYIGSN